MFRPTVTVHHADRQDAVQIEPAGPELAPFTAFLSRAQEGAPGGEEAVGMSASLKLDDAFAEGLNNLPPF